LGRPAAAGARGSRFSIAAEIGAPDFLATGVAVNQAPRIEVVLGMAVVAPLFQEMHVERNENPPADVRDSRKDVFRLALYLEAAMTMLHPHVISEHHYLPEWLLFVEFQRHFFSPACATGSACAMLDSTSLMKFLRVICSGSESTRLPAPSPCGLSSITRIS